MEQRKNVFVSYSSNDIKIVNRIVANLEQLGIAYWKAPEMIPAGSSYAREIPRAIRECEVFLLLLSRTSQESIWVEKEIDYAISGRKKIIPLQIDDVSLNDTFRFYLNNVQMISYFDNSDRALDVLKREFSTLSRELSTDGTIVEEEVTASSSISPRTGMHVSSGGTEKGGKMSFVKHARTTSNALRMNRIPLDCKYCGSKHLDNYSMGYYRCMQCGRDNYDDFQTIRNYLGKVGNATSDMIERDTGVPKRVIDYFFREEYLEIPKSSPIRIPCKKCGAPIRTGELCDECKRKAASTTTSKTSTRQRRESWHSR